MTKQATVMVRTSGARAWGAVLLALVVVFSGRAPVFAQPAPLRGIDAYITKAMADWEVPGLALAIVKDDSVVYSAGYGVRALNKPDRVDVRTMFAIGSSSKAFTAAILAMLVDEGKASWDDPVTKHLPWFQVFDPYASREMNIRDVLSHRSGLARGDRIWYATGLEREEIVRRVRLLEPSWSFRSAFGYQNIMYLTAGEVAEEITGKSWDDLVRERIFTPLGMRESNTSITALGSNGNVATPHAKLEKTVMPIAWRNIDNAGPAGSINSNVLEVAQWVRLQLGKGRYAGQQLISERSIRTMHSPHTIIPIDTANERLYPDTHFRLYGLGWFLEDYRGRKLVHHGGNIDGMSALVAMMPEENLGLVILTNMNGTGLPNTLMLRVFDAYLGGPQRDWSAQVLAIVKERQARAEAEQEKQLAARVTGTQPSLPLDRYAGTYEDAMYGSVRVVHESGKLMLNAGPAFMAEMEHWHFDTFRARWQDPMLGRTFVTFHLDAQAKPSTLDVQGLAEFRRAAERPAATAPTAR